MNVVERARKLRATMTRAERALWERLRNRRVGGRRFRRQHPMGQYVVDFVCLDARLIIEIDGACHEGRKERDEARQKVLEGQGYKVLRFSNFDVTTDLDGVVMQVRRGLDLGGAYPPIGRQAGHFPPRGR